MKERKYWIDAVRFLCIIAVYYTHSSSFYGVAIKYLNFFISPWYVNAFFFMSGYLLFGKQLSEPRIQEDVLQYFEKGGKSLLLNILFRIIIPSVLFSIIEFLPSCIIQGREIDIGSALYKTIGGGTYWFTSALVVAELILLILFFTRNKCIWFYVVVCIAFSATGLAIVSLDIPNNSIWAWRQGILALFFLAMGGLYWIYEKQIDTVIKGWLAVLFLIVYLLLVIGLKNYNNPLIGTLSIKPLGFITSTMSCLLLVWFCKLLPEMKLISFVGQNTIVLYFMSGALPFSLSLLSHKILTYSSIWVMLLIWILSIAISYCIVLLINLWFPWILDLRKIIKKS